MENHPQRTMQLANFIPVFPSLLVIISGLILLGWFVETPPGLLGKADAVAYAVCHRIASHSFSIGDRQLPLCARCTGMYLGALLGIIYLSRFGRRAGMPSLKVSIVLGVFLAAFAVDGGNSYLHFLPNGPGLYQPENWLRLATGTGVGMGIAAILVPVVHQTLWQTVDTRRALAGWKQFLPLLGLAVLVNLAVLSGNPLLLYPLALLGAVAILVLLSIVYMMVWVMIARRENRFTSYQNLLMPLMAGFCSAMVQIAVIDAGRFWLTGTWGGFKL